MKIRVLIKIVAISFILLLFVGLGLYSYFRLSEMQKSKDFDLYSLVPKDACAVFEASNLDAFMAELDKISSSNNINGFHVSPLFSLIHSQFQSLSKEFPHGLSEEMNRMLISFHSPDEEQNQILYCNLASGDGRILENFIRKHCASVYPFKYIDYRGQEIRIYIMPDGKFLACYFTSHFAAISYHKRLLEEVIDSYISGKSLLKDVDFKRLRDSKRMNSDAAIYIRMFHVPMGKMTDGIHSFASLGGWTVFDLKMRGDAIYLSGLNHAADTCPTFMNTFRKQDSIQGFPEEDLPASAFSFAKRSISNLQLISEYTASYKYATRIYTDNIRRGDEKMFSFLKDNAGNNLVSCLFEASDTLRVPCAIIIVPMIDLLQAKRMLQSFLASVSLESSKSFLEHEIVLRTKLGKYTIFNLPQNTLFVRFTGIAPDSLESYVCFYHNSLLVASDKRSLATYLHLMDEEGKINSAPIYREVVSSLAPSYNFMSVSDLEDVFAQPEKYVRLIPSFFFIHREFFCHFILSMQLVCEGEDVYPNVTLLYKGQ